MAGGSRGKSKAVHLLGDGALEGQGRHGRVARDRATGRSDVTSTAEVVHNAATFRMLILNSPSAMAVTSCVPTAVNLGLRVPTSSAVVFGVLASPSALATILAACYNLGSYCYLSAKITWLKELSDRVMLALEHKVNSASLVITPDDIVM